MCPACGGKLDARRASASVEGARGARGDPHRVRDRARRPGVLHAGAAKETSDPALQELFAKFAEMEKEHMATLSRRYHAEIPVPSPEFQVDARRDLRGHPEPPRGPGEPVPHRDRVRGARGEVLHRARRADARPARPSASSTRSSPPRSASTSRSSRPSSSAGSWASRGSCSLPRVVSEHARGPVERPGLSLFARRRLVAACFNRGTPEQGSIGSEHSLTKVLVHRHGRT